MQHINAIPSNWKNSLKSFGIYSQKLILLDQHLKKSLDISSGDIDRTHRIGTPPKQSGKKIDPLLVRLYGTKTG